MNRSSYDLIVIGSGPGGQKAAIQGAKLGKRVALVERDRAIGGACVHRGTIPSKTLRASAFEIAHLEQLTKDLDVVIDAGAKMSRLRSRLSRVISGHVRVANDQLARNKVTILHGRASFIDSTSVEILRPDGSRFVLQATNFVIATGSRPRTPDCVQLDHEQILDSDSLLALDYLPDTLTILGGGIIASEYASIFAAVGVTVTMIDRFPRPIGFLDEDLSDDFVRHLEAQGGCFLGDRKVEEVSCDDFGGVTTRLCSGETLYSDKLLVANGRIPNIEGLGLSAAGVRVGSRGTIEVDEHYQTSQSNIAAVGDVVGFPALASYSMDQGRRAVLALHGIDSGEAEQLIPMGIFTIPEIACVGMSERDANTKLEKYGGKIVVGRSSFDELARAHISTSGRGMLKIVSDAAGRRILGVAISGEGAIELVHIGQMAIRCGASVQDLIETVFNFPTLAEAYRVAALDIVKQIRCATEATERNQLRQAMP